jgi:tRNA-intron endonuclease
LTIQVQLVEDNRLVVWEKEDVNALYRSGFYGRPITPSKPREEIEGPLILDAIEGLYLLEKNIIDVKDSKNKYISYKDLRVRLSQVFTEFEGKYMVYKELRNRGLVVTPGIKYGCDFAVYEHGPGIDHAPYIIQIENLNKKLGATTIVRSGRLATTVRKSFIVAAVGEVITYLEFNWWKA